MKIAKFNKDIKNILNEESKKRSGKSIARFENGLVKTFASEDDAETIEIKCQTPANILDDAEALRIDDYSSYPIYVIATKSKVSVVAEADKIEWRDDLSQLHLLDRARKVKHIIVHDVDFSKCKSLSEIFYSDRGVIDFDFQNLSGFENVEEAEGMFSMCENIRTIDMAEFRGMLPKCTTNMFSCCCYLTEIKNILQISSNCVETGGMFSHCYKIRTLDLNDWDMSNVRCMNGMFEQCNNLKELHIEDWNTKNMVDASYMFSQCGIEKMPVERWDVSNLLNAKAMFCYCDNMISLDLSQWNTENLQYTDSMFGGCENLEHVNLKNWKTSKVLNVSGMFERCKNLKELHIEGWNTKNVVDASYMFSQCGIEKMPVEGWDVSSLRDARYMFCNCKSMGSLDLFQ